MQETPIGWTNYSCNALKMRMPDGSLINVCIHKSEGCRFCYAEALVRRWWKKEWGEFPGYTAALLKIGTPVLQQKQLEAVLRLDKRIAAGKADKTKNRIFWHDMTDEGLEFWPDEFLDTIWAVRALTPNLIHQVLTKRIDRIHDYFKNRFTRHHAAAKASLFSGKHDGATGTCDSAICNAEFPYPNVHLGVSVEDQKNADERIPLLLETPAVVHWISAEPLLGPIDLSNLKDGTYDALSGIDFEDIGDIRDVGVLGKNEIPGLAWVVVGGESGANRRNMEVEWLTNIVASCQKADIPAFVKQDSALYPGQQGRVPTEYWIHEFPKVSA